MDQQLMISDIFVLICLLFHYVSAVSIQSFWLIGFSGSVAPLFAPSLGPQGTTVCDGLQLN